uniref:nucleosome assembly protein 1;2 n=1 Tax=Erigeron canadensis TaxID=72917 RepID=UPI001CB9D66F|nr:nucleosome assembly protein 1;2 [Erigeron canadensis]
MEIESKNGSKIQLKNPSEITNFGRESMIPFDPISEKTVSRHHISFKVNESQTSVDFKVKGKNPIWVLHKNTNEIKVYKCSENGSMKAGDSFCVCSKNPVWFHLKKVENDEVSRYDDVLEENFEEVGFGDDVESFSCDVIDIDDPIKEFGFVVMGHEFDSYPKKMVRDIRNWDWFLEESKEESDDDEVSDRKPKKGSRRKRKKGGGGDDEDDDIWTGESEEDTEIIKKLKNDPKPNYPTRSKKQEKNKKGASGSRSVKDTKQKDAVDDFDDDVEDEDENDETLGGFIVDDEDVGEADDDDDEGEEEFVEDDEEDE